MGAGLEEAVVLITGASSGIGRALAHAFASEGARVVLGGRDVLALAEVEEELRERGASASFLAEDLRGSGAVERLFDFAESTFGPVNIAVNNAGVGTPAAVIDGDEGAWREMLETNLLTLLLGCREAARRMAGRGGTIVNVSSAAVAGPTPGDAVYTATKQAVSGFSESFVGELDGTGVRLLLVEPGQTMTSFGRSLSHGQVRELALSLGLDPEAVPDFHGGHVPESFMSHVLQRRPDVFLDPMRVAENVVEALKIAGERFQRLRILPGAS